MKKRIVAIAPIIVAFISIAFMNCGDDGGGGGTSAPNAPTNPYPGANAKNVPTNTVLAWDCTDADGNELKYDVYLGTSSSPPRVGQDVSPPYYAPPKGLDADTKYYWKIIAKDGTYSTGGPTWSFKTAEAGGGGGGGGPEPKTGYAEFIPLNVGNTWVYEYTYSDEEGPREKDEYELLVVDKFDNYHGFESYLVKCKWQYRIPQVRYITLGYDGDKCYLFTCPWWEFLIEDDMAWMAWSQTGLLSYCRLQFNFTKDVSVPAGYFTDCKQLAVVHKHATYTETHEECYAKGVGLVYYRYRVEYSATNWWQYEYKLKNYKVTPP